MELPPTGHDPVLLEEVRDALGLKPGATYVDCTLGRGGHASAYAAILGGNGQLIALDVDERNLTYAQQRLASLGTPRRFFHANFTDLAEVCRQAGIGGADAIFADLGISTNQLFDPHYGLSMSVDSPLDMRLDQKPSAGMTSAADIVNRWREEDIADVLYNNADERLSRRIARKIAAERRIAPILTTERLADIVSSAVIAGGGGRAGGNSIHPATRTFQALRMEANREVANLERLLRVAPGLLNLHGRLAVISFHSGEDRRVKEAFRLLGSTGPYQVIGKKPITPAEAELARNPRSRSAKLRVLERVA